MRTTLDKFRELKRKKAEIKLIDKLIKALKHFINENEIK